MKVLLSDSPPFAFNNCVSFPILQPTTNCRFPGYAVEIIKMLVDYAKINFEPYVVDANVVEWGTFENDTWTGMMDILYEGSADVINDVMQYTDQRAKDFDYSYPIYNLQIIYITKQKRNDLMYYLWNSFSPFTFRIWSILFGLICLLTGLAILIQYAEWRLGFVRSFNWRGKIGQHVRVIFNQVDRPLFSYTLADRIVFIIFGFVLVNLFSHLYGAFLLSPLLLQVENKPFNNFEELLALIRAGTYHVVVDEQNYQYYWYYEYVRTSNDSHFRRLRNALRGNPLLIVENITVALNVVEQGNYVYPTQQDQPEMVQARLRCDLMFMDIGLPQTGGYFLFHKNSSFLPIINEAIKMNTQFIAYVFQKYFSENFMLKGERKDCEDDKGRSEAEKPLSLMSTFGIFLIFACCLGVSGISFILEQGYFYWIKFRQTQHEKKPNTSRISVANDTIC